LECHALLFVIGELKADVPTFEDELVLFEVNCFQVEAAELKVTGLELPSRWPVGSK
jgi:hypothetical protein